MKKRKTVIVLAVAFLIAAVTVGGVMVHQQQKISKMHKSAVAAITKVADKSDYRSKEAKEVQAIIDEYSTKINQENDQKKTDALVKQAKEKIGALKTEAQYEKEEKAAREKKAAEKKAAKEKAEAEKKAAANAAAEDDYDNSGNNYNEASSEGAAGGAQSDGCVNGDSSDMIY